MPDKTPEQAQNPGRRRFLKAAVGGAALAGLVAADALLLKKAFYDAKKTSRDDRKEEEVPEHIRQFDAIFDELNGDAKPDWTKVAWVTQSFSAPDGDYFLSRVNDGRRVVQRQRNPATKEDQPLNYRIEATGETFELSGYDLPLPNPTIMDHDIKAVKLSPDMAKNMVGNLKNAFDNASRDTAGKPTPSASAPR